MSNVASSKSESLKLAILRSHSLKSHSRRLQDWKAVFFIFNRKNEARLRLQLEKFTSKRKELQCSKCRPSNLQSLNFTSRKEEFVRLAMLKSHPMKVQSENRNPLKSVFVNKQSVNVQFSYSANSSCSVAEFSFLNC